jgi:hypothetical protein
MGHFGHSSRFGITLGVAPALLHTCAYQVDCRSCGLDSSFASRLWTVLGFELALALVDDRFTVFGRRSLCRIRYVTGALTHCLKRAWICISTCSCQVDCRGFGLSCSLANRRWMVLGFGLAHAVVGGRFAVFWLRLLCRIPYVTQAFDSVFGARLDLYQRSLLLG